MKIIYIVGGNGFARECYNILKGLQNFNKELKFGGFLGHNGYGHTVDYKEYQKFYKGEFLKHKLENNDYFIIGAGYPDLRKKIYFDLKKFDVKFYTLKGADVVFSETFEYGEANIFVPPFHPSINIQIGNCNVFNGGDIVIGHDTKIGNFNFFGPSSKVLGSVIVGDSNMIGTASVLLPKVKIGNNNKIAPLSAVYKGCKDNCYMLGNPALKVGEME